MRGQHVVSGPGTEGRAAPGAHVALSVAQQLACKATGEGTWYVRDPEGRVVYHVTRTGRTVLTTRPERQPAAERQAAEAQTLEEATA